MSADFQICISVPLVPNADYMLSFCVTYYYQSIVDLVSMLQIFVGNKAKWQISKPVFQENKHAKSSEKQTFLTP